MTHTVDNNVPMGRTGPRRGSFLTRPPRRTHAGDAAVAADSRFAATDPGNTSTIPMGASSVDGGGPTSSFPPPVDDVHRKWSSLGDPHIKMGNENFDNMRRGDFIILESQDKSFQVQARQEPLPGNENLTFNSAVAIKDGDNVVTYDSKTKRLLLNGQEWTGPDPQDSQTQPDGTRPDRGTFIEKTGDGYRVTSSKGDTTQIHDRGNYVDLEGEIGPDRAVGEVRGAHGVFDNTDGAESHMRRDGTQAATTDEMIETWRPRPEENLFEIAGKGGPGDPPPIDEETRKGLTDIYAQLMGLTNTLGALLKNLGIEIPPPDTLPVDPLAPPLAGGPAPVGQTFEDQLRADNGRARGTAAEPPDLGGPPPPVDPATGAPLDPATGAPIDPGTGRRHLLRALLATMTGLTQMLTRLITQLQGGLLAGGGAPPAADDQPQPLGRAPEIPGRRAA